MKSIVSDPDWLPKAVNFLFAVIAFLSVGFSFLNPWYALPYVSGVDHAWGTHDSIYTIYFKVALVAVTLGFVWWGYWMRRRIQSYGAMMLRYGLCCLVLILWFPTWLTVRDADVIGDGAWLQQQHDTLTWLGGDIYRAHAERSVELGTGVNAQDPPERLAVYRPPIGSLGIHRINDWLWWLGYGPAFTQFVGKGWFYAVAGYALGCICLCGFYWRRSVLGARHLFRQLVILLFFLFLCVGCISVAVVGCARCAMVKSEASTARGDYQQARDHLRKAIRYMPSLGCDSGVIRQLGYFDVQLDEADSDVALLYQVFWFEQQGYYGRARKLVSRLAERKGEMNRECGRELTRHQLRIAVNYINSGRYQLAILHLDQILEHDGNALQACFHQQLMALQTDDVGRNRQMNSRLRAIYQGVKSKNKRGVMAASWWMLAQGEMKAGNEVEAWEARKKSKGQ
ncbi:MAG: hypothetical protein KJO21_12725 [Verrucomicrobiae bacterium]|nr:hypothetical protein [Verrucomicrobiae bacterium]NNJ43591.1 hypothetical protein [Akkermansiaceae bacterium]